MNTKHNRRMTALLLLAVMLLSALLVSCGSDTGANADAETTTASGETTAPETTTEPKLMPDIEGLDFDGADFVIMIPNDWSLYQDYYIAEEENGDVLNDAIYQRKVTVEEDLNVKMIDKGIGGTETAGINRVYPLIQQSVLAGDSSYDLAATHCITHLNNLTNDKLLVDWNTVGNVNFEMPWWNKMMNETMSVNGKMYFAANDYIIPDPNAVYFNKEILTDYNIDTPYQFVTDGAWTLDKLAELSANVYSDLNGDGSKDASDEFGFYTAYSWTSISIMYSCGQFMLREEGDQMLLDINNEKMINIATKFYELLDAPTSFAKYVSNCTDEEKKIFENGRALFTLNTLNKAKTWRSLEIDFGILPYPKYDEHQDEYISNNWSGLLVIPIDAKDIDMTGAVSEYLGYLSGEMVLPLYYDVLLDTKFARDEESSEMLDIIFGNSAYDIGMVYSNFNNLFYTLVYMHRDGNPDFASYYATYESTVQASYDKAFSVYFE